MIVEFPVITLIVSQVFPKKTRRDRNNNKISGPLLDRIDLHVEVVPVPFSELQRVQSSWKSSAIRNRVIMVREIQAKRFAEKEDVFVMHR